VSVCYPEYDVDEDLVRHGHSNAVAEAAELFLLERSNRVVAVLEHLHDGRQPAAQCIRNNLTQGGATVNCHGSCGFLRSLGMFRFHF